VKSIKEKQMLVKWAKAFNEEIDSNILKDVEEYERLQSELKESLKEKPLSVEGASVIEAQPLTENTIKEEKLEELKEQIIEKTNLITKSVEEITKSIVKEDSFQQPNPQPVDKNLTAIQSKLKFLEQAIGKIAAHGAGSGEVNLRYLDDVARETIADGRWLKYDGASKKFVFDEINPYEVVYNTTEVTTSTYTVEDNDYYIGVNYAGPATITLPSTANSGRVLVIKDEDGDAETNPITVQGTVDNDAGGFIIQINNGSIQLIYRNGWRIV
jgi:hypothetical protein